MLRDGGFVAAFTLLCILHVVTPGMSVVQSINGQPLCPDGWQDFTEQVGQGHMCYLPVSEPKSWTDAADHCRSHVAHLMNMDGVQTYFKQEVTDATTSLGNYLFGAEQPTFWTFWTGMSVKGDRLMWEANGPQFVQKSSYSNSHWSWAPQEPSLDAGTCGLVELTYATETVFDEMQGGDVNVTTFNNNYLISLENCDDKRPFVCQKTRLLPEVKRISSCPGEWVGNLGLQQCYLLFVESTTYVQALETCQSVGGEIAPSATEFDLDFIYYVYNYFSNTDKYVEVTQLPGIWVKTPTGQQLEQSCKAFDTAMIDGVIAYTSFPCEKTLPFFCIKPTVPGKLKSLSSNTVYTNPIELLESPPFTSFPVSGMMSRAPLESEILFIQTPLGVFNSTLDWMNAQQIRYRVEVLTSQASDIPYYFNISVPGDVTLSPQRRKREAQLKGGYMADDEPNRKKRQFPSEGVIVDPIFLDFNKAVQYVGYYRFGVYAQNPARYHQTQPLLVRYSESDMYIYVVSLRMQDWITSMEGELRRDQMIAFNLLQDESYVNTATREYTSGLLDRPPSGGPLTDTIQYYTGTPESIRNNTLYIRLYVTLASGRTFAGAEVEQTLMASLQQGWKQMLSGSDFFIKASIKFRSTVMCQTRKYTDEASSVTVTFPATLIGTKGYSWERCVGGAGARAWAMCKGDFSKGARWAQLTLSSGCDIPTDLPESNTTADLKKLAETELNYTNVFDVLDLASNLTSPSFNLTALDVIYAADILQNIFNVELSNEVMLNGVADILNNVLNTEDGVIKKAQKVASAGNRIARVMDEITFQVQSLDRKLRVVRDYVAAEVLQQTDDGTRTLTIGIDVEGSMVQVFNESSLMSVQQTTDVVVNFTDVAIYLPKAALKGGSSRLSFHIYAKPDLFATDGDRYEVNSKVAAARLSKGDKRILDLGDNRVTAVFLPLKDDKFLTCGYWNYSEYENSGGWRTGGCTFTATGDRIVCECDHLTNFAVLIDRDAHLLSDTDKLVLSIITKVGLIVSIIGLGLTVLTFIIFKHLRNGRGQQVLVNLSTAMLCSSIVFLVGSERTENYGGCVAVAVLLHYFILVSFMWMLVEGVLQYLRFVKVLGTYIPRFMFKTMLPAWGLPLIPVIVLLALDYDLYYSGKGYCWLESDAMLYAFIIPVAVVIFANIIVFLMVMCSLFRRGKGLQVNQSERKMAFLHFQAAVCIFVVLGLTWVFGFLAIEGARTVFNYIFAILNAFQGLFIFLLFTAREKQIRNAWKKLCCKRRTDKSFTSATDSHGAKKTKTTNLGTSKTGSTANSGGDDPRFDDIRYDNVPSKNGGNRHGMQFENQQYGK